MSESKKNSRIFRDSLTVINHPRALRLPKDFFENIESKVEDKKTKDPEYSKQIEDR